MILSMNCGSCEGFRTPRELQRITAKSNKSCGARHASIGSSPIPPSRRSAMVRRDPGPGVAGVARLLRVRQPGHRSAAREPRRCSRASSAARCRSSPPPCQMRRSLSWPVEQIAPSHLLRIIGVLDFEQSRPRIVAVSQALGDDAFQVVRARQVEEFAAAAGNGKRLGNDRRYCGKNSLQPLPAFAERQRPVSRSAPSWSLIRRYRSGHGGSDPPGLPFPANGSLRGKHLNTRNGSPGQRQKVEIVQRRL